MRPSARNSRSRCSSMAGGNKLPQLGPAQEEPGVEVGDGLVAGAGHVSERLPDCHDGRIRPPVAAAAAARPPAGPRRGRRIRPGRPGPWPARRQPGIRPPADPARGARRQVMPGQGSSASAASVRTGADRVGAAAMPAPPSARRSRYPSRAGRPAAGSARPDPCARSAAATTVMTAAPPARSIGPRSAGTSVALRSVHRGGVPSASYAARRGRPPPGCTTARRAGC